MKALRVGIDLTGIWRPSTGIFRYATEVTSHLLMLRDEEPPVRYVLFFARTVPAEFATAGGNFDAVLCPTTNELVAKQVWMPLVLPRLNLDVMHYPAFPPPRIRLSAPRTVMTLHDAGPWRHPQDLTAHGRLYFRTLLAHGVRAGDRVIAVSQHAKAEIGHFLGVRYLAQITVIPEAARPEFTVACSTASQEDVRTRYGLPDRFFLSVATVEPRKNLPRLLEAVAGLREEVGSSCPPLVIVGRRGWNCADTLQYMAELADVVRFAGYVRDEELVALYQTATCLVFPSLYEGFGLPVVEAMAAGCPVITSRVSSLPEVASDAGLLVDPLSAADIASAMRRILDDDSLRARMVREGRRQASRFSWLETARLTRQEYVRAAGAA